MADIEEILRANPKAAEQLPAIRAAIEELQALRDAGIARGSVVGMETPYGGRQNLEQLKSSRKHQPISK